MSRQLQDASRFERDSRDAKGTHNFAMFFVRTRLWPAGEVEFDSRCRGIENWDRANRVSFRGDRPRTSFTPSMLDGLWHRTVKASPRALPSATPNPLSELTRKTCRQTPFKISSIYTVRISSRFELLNGTRGLFKITAGSSDKCNQNVS